MAWLLLILAGVILCFTLVLLVGPPYLPTLKKQINIALDLAELKSGETLLELGSGDGRVALAAAKRGYQVVGYELNPIMLLVSIAVTWRYRRLVRFHWRNFLRADWPEVDAVFIFGIDKIMPKVNSRLNNYPKKPVKLVSFTFRIEGKRPSTEREGLFVYNY